MIICHLRLSVFFSLFMFTPHPPCKLKLSIQHFSVFDWFFWWDFKVVLFFCSTQVCIYHICNLTKNGIPQTFMYNYEWTWKREREREKIIFMEKWKKKRIMQWNWLIHVIYFLCWCRTLFEIDWFCWNLSSKLQ